MSTDPLTHESWSYVPILKGKTGEYEALRGLDRATRGRLVPLVVLGGSTDSAQPIQDLAAALGRMRLGWGRQGPIIIDGCWLRTAEQFADSLAAASQLDWLAIPSTRLTDPPAYHEVVRSVGERGSGITLRLNLSDIADADTLKRRFEAFFVEMGVDPSAIDLILDARDVEFMRLGATSLAVVNAIRSLPWIEEWRHLIVAATGAPASLKEFEMNLITAVPRNEAILFEAIRKADLERVPTYADYVIAHPDPVEDQAGRATNMTASLRYSIEDRVLIVKGIRVKDNGSALFPDLLRQLVGLPEFAKRGFSRGDDWIEDAASRNVGPGNAQKWREAATSHHLTMITRLFATPVGL